MTYPNIAPLRTQTETLTLAGDQMLLLLQLASLGQAVAKQIVNLSQIESVRECMATVGDERADAVYAAATAMLMRYAESAGSRIAYPDRDA